MKKSATKVVEAEPIEERHLLKSKTSNKLSSKTSRQLKTREKVGQQRELSRQTNTPMNNFKILMKVWTYNFIH